MIITNRPPISGLFIPVSISLVMMSGGIFGAGAMQVQGPTTRLSSDTTVSTGMIKPWIPRLTVRPRQMATGTETRQAGLTSLDGFDGYYVYVPAQCVGNQRSPLVLLLHGGGSRGLKEVTKFQALADKYGMIILAANADKPGRWEVGWGWALANARSEKIDYAKADSMFPKRDVLNIDSVLTQVLRTYAIDPDRIAVTGFSDGGSTSLFLGQSNLDVFSRIIPLAAFVHAETAGPSNPATQFFLSGSDGEKLTQKTLILARTLRQRGHPVVTQIGLRTHWDYLEDEAFIWAWLQQSWADPGTTTRIPKEPETDPVLTEDALRRLTAFWTRFPQLPDSIRNMARMQHQMQLSMMIGSEPTTVIMMNLPALAAAYPSMATLLNSVGLTAAQAMAYRIAVVRTGIARVAGMTIGERSTASSTTDSPFAPIAPASVLGRNMKFWRTHEAMFTELEKTGMWMTQ